MPTIRRGAWACLSLPLFACGGGGSGEVSCVPNPSPSITSTPPTVATVGQQYRYRVEASYNCVFFLCRDVIPVALPAGAELNFSPAPFIVWTPTPSQGNANFSFLVVTPRDACGNQASQSWTVFVLPDTTPPSVTAVWPAALSTNNPIDSNISVSFSEPMNAASVNPSSFQVQGPGGVIPGSITSLSGAATFTPSTSLPPSSVFTVTVTTAVQDLSGNALPSDFTSTFTTSSATPPPPGWTRATIDGSVDVAWTSIAVDSANQPYIAYQDGRYTASNQQVGDVKLATKAGTWQLQVLDDIGTSVTASLAALIDPAGAAHVLYFDPSLLQLKHATNAPGFWNAEIVAPQTHNVSTVAVTRDAAGRLHVVYNPSGIVTYATDASGAWTTQTIASNEVIYGGALTAGIALDPEGKVHVAYYDHSALELRHATNASGSWVSQTIDTQGEVGLHLSIASDGAGKLHVSYYDAANGDLKYATNAPGPWTTEIVDSGGDVGVGTAVGLDATQGVHIAYTDASSHTLKYATNAGGAWSILTIDNAVYVGGILASDNSYPAIAVDSLGKAHISYRGSGFLRYATNQ